MGFHGDGITAAEAEWEINRVIAVNSATYTASAMHYNFLTSNGAPHPSAAIWSTDFICDGPRSEASGLIYEEGGRLKRRNGANNRRNEPPLSFARIATDRPTEGEGEKSPTVKNAAAAL